MNRSALAAVTALVSLCLAVPGASAQIGALRVGMQAPTAASLGKFGDVPVSLYTGTPSITIPLYELTGRTLSLPIALRYHAAGNKVEEIPGWVGLGWALDAGGVITRTVRGLRDERGRGYQATGHRLWIGRNWENPSTGFINQMAAEQVDVEPDNFFFNVAGRSGQFILGPTRGPATGIKTAPYEKLAITPTLTNDVITSWTIRTEDGTEYLFGQCDACPGDGLEATTDISRTLRQFPVSSEYGVPYVSSWYLMRINAAQGDDFIAFEYEDYTVSRDLRAYQEAFDYVVPLSGAGRACNALRRNEITTTHTTHGKRLRAIKTGAYTVLFDAVPRADGEYRLDTIRVHANDAEQALVKKIVLRYQTVAGRLFLKDVQDVAPDGSGALPPYVLHYEAQPLPDYRSTAIDHWGYYNGASNGGNLVPALLFGTGAGTAFLAGANREPNAETMHAGLLTRIDYPTGGSAAFAYEPHAYASISGATDFLVLSEVDSTIHETAGGGSTTRRDFVVGGDAEAQAVLEVAIDAPCRGDEICFEDVRLLGPEGPIRQYHADTTATDHLALPPGAYQIEITTEFPESFTSVMLTWRERRSINTLPVQRAIAGGVRIQSIRTDDALGGVRETRYRYRLDAQRRPSRSSGVLVSAPRYDYAWATRPCGYLSRSSASRLPLGSGQGGHIGYKEVSVLHDVDAQGTPRAGTTVHFFFTADEAGFDDEVLTRTRWPFAARTSRGWKRGLLKERRVYRADGVLLRTTEPRYAFVEQEDNPLVGATYRGLSYLPVTAKIDVVSRYEIVSAWVHPVSETVTLYDENTGASTTTTRAYRYDARDLQLDALEETNTDGRVRVTEYAYAHEQDGAPDYTAMRDKNMLTQRFSRTVREGRTLKARQWTCWAYVPQEDTWRPASAWIWTGGGRTRASPCRLTDPAPPYTDPATRAVLLTRYAGYDRFGRVTRQQGALGHMITFEYRGPQGRLDDFFLTRVAQTPFSVQYTYHDAGYRWGLVHQLIDENGHATAYDYDRFRRLASVTTPLGGFTSYAYQQQTVPHALTTTTALDGSRSIVTKDFFDGLGRPVQTQLRENAHAYLVSATDYDALGRVEKAWKPYRQPTGGAYQDRPRVRTDAQAYYDRPGCTATPYVALQYRPDPLSRIAAVLPEHCNGDATPLINTYGVEGGLTVVRTTDEDARVTKTYTDAFGNPVRTETGIGTPEAAVTERAYDVLGNLVAVAPPAYHCTPGPGCDAPGDARWITAYRVDPRGLRIAKTTPDTDAAFAYTYDAKGHLRFVEDPNHVLRSGSGFLYTQYDDFDRVVETGVYGGATPFAAADPNDSDWPLNPGSEAVSYTYDTTTPSEPLGRLTIQNANGRLTQVRFDGGYYQYSYDDAGRVEAMHVHLDSLGNKLIEYAYDRRGHVTSVHYQAGEKDGLHLTYAYDDAGRLQKVASQTGDDALPVQEAFYTYTPAGQVEALQLGADPDAILPIDYAYHIRDWLTQINDPANLGDHVFALRLGYDAAVVAGAPVYHTGTIGSAEWATEGNQAVAARVGYAFTYDARNRLTAADFLKYEADRWEPEAAYSVGAPLVYDPNGNIRALTRRDQFGVGTSIHYDYQGPSGLFGNRLQALSGDVSARFAYDPNGNMTRSRGAAAVVHDRRNLPTAMALSGDSLLFRYDADGQRIYKKLVTRTGQTETFYLRGAEGTVLAVYVNEGDGLRLAYWNLVSGTAVIGRIEPSANEAD